MAYKPDKHGRDHCPGGEDPIPCLTSTTWACLSTATNGWEYQGAGADDIVDWYEIFLSESSADVFDFEVVVAGGQFGDDIVFLNAFDSGQYTFTQQFLTSDLSSAAGSEDFHYQTRLNVMGGSPGTSFGANADVFPGQIGSVALLQDREQFWIGNSSGDDLWLNRSWTLPVRHPTPGNPLRMGEIKMFHNEPHDSFWTVRLWVVRHGDMDWPQANDFDGANTTWP